MTEQISGGGVGKYLAAPISAGFGILITWLAAGSTETRTGLVAFFAIVSGVAGAALSHIYRRYVGVLAAGARPKGSPARLAYDSLRESLSEGNIAARLYARRLNAFLNAVDHFFGDAGMADRTLFPRAFGLKTPAPLWTAHAFDRCLLLALIYPIATIFIIWAVSGHVGPAEAAFGLKTNFSDWRRGFETAGVGLMAFAAWRTLRSRNWWFFIWLATRLAFFLVFESLTAFPLSFAFAVSITTGVAATGGAYRGRPITGVGTFGRIASVINAAMGSGFGGFSVVTLFFTAFVGHALSTPTPILVGIFFGWLNDKVIESRWYGFFLSLSFLAIVLACLGTAYVLPPLGSWVDDGPLFLFLGLITLLNAPFDWASLGLTRALLRRGLELGGWWPYVLSVADGLLATVIVTMLAITLVVGVQAFDGLATQRGAEPTLPLNALFNGLATHPTAPEFWWLYALLLSTIIPSIMNLVIGGASLLRGVPGLPGILLKFMPVGKVVPDFDRRWIALVLTIQVAVGAIMGIAAQALLAVGVIFYIMPWLSFGLLDITRDVAAFNLPLRVWQLFGSTP